VDGKRVLVGSQPVGMYCAEESDWTWRQLTSFPRRGYWWQPATSPHRQGYVSALAVAGDVIIAGIEAFKGFRSVDAGETWVPVGHGFTRDCHALVLAHGRAYQGAGLGPSWSLDAGKTWHQVRVGLDRRYVMAIAVDPADADCWYIAAAPLLKAHSRNSHARLFRWSGGSWLPLTDELSELPHALHCPEPDTVTAGLRDGTIVTSTDRGNNWHTITQLPGIRDLT
jgi:hypothetical protein